MVKATGFEITDFYRNHFPEGYYYECYEDELEIEDYNGYPLLENDVKYELSSFGSLIQEEGDKTMSFSSAFLKHKKTKNVEYLLIEVPKGSKDKAVEQISNLGYKIK